ncbi:hypothetical protein GOL96_21925 [Sinorhizobium medicae]|nr:hypothetical protein [Sinorhizobium medicae]MDX0417499.1 hypothetical protein [Sinorhizobium medicae]MDX1031863.1 hypothetical protein [Sinorhizobium medicae]MDX1194141.1 hypothetical protein [Sinorhizobium medicae]MDX1236494.1 hypothetical protein [Sinorhizobium medicae]
MKYLFDSIQLLPFEMRDPKTRKAVFREAGKSYTKWQRDLTDRPGAIARLLEMAFSAGVAHAGEAPVTDVDAAPVVARMHDIDVPSLSRDVLEDFRGYQVGSKSGGAPPKLEDYALAREPGSGVPGRKRRDRWVECGSKLDRSHSTKAIGPLVKLGLFEETALEFSDGTTADGLVITEWGIELLLTGATTKLEHRQDGGSSTYPTYLALSEHRPIPRTDGAITLWDVDSHVAAFLIDHRVNGIGRPERLEGGACAEDMAYFLEALEYPDAPTPIEIWRLFRTNPAIKTHMFDRLVKELLDEGILLAADEEQLFMSEWGYELIRTGETAALDKRTDGASSTYREYQAILRRHAR